ncbi:phage transcriptional regulator, ArpU family [Aneurinibacillus aneurinilyticus ATCC 12856]|uniref:Phage transcriptional regulator, ArpU family n=1 Tax=Aneurinibacillus aneurinilyticus ATCC 12856 TaxID=649747 RepID=U1YED0_ANEAE|nr:phage transcriptional regulator, ArpU family [Aneurinibacillus aneurinilyticus ATCC 12856]
MGAKQLSFLEEVNEKDVQDIVIEELKNYRALKVQMENKREREMAGIVDLFPSLRQADKENELKVRQIDRALENSLDVTERIIVEQKYIDSKELTDMYIYTELGLKKGEIL